VRSKLPLTLGRIAKATALAKTNHKNVWLSDDIGYRGPGRLVARVSPSTARFYFRHCVDGSRHLVPIGPFNVAERPGYVTLDQARHTAQRWSLERGRATSPATNIGDNEHSRSASLMLPHHVAETSKTTTSQKPQTLWNLCCAYHDLLSKKGKPSARQVQNTFKRYIASHALAQQPASQVTAQQISDLLREMVGAGKENPAASLRSYLHAAYESALRAALDPRKPTSMIFPGVQFNPVSVIPALPGGCPARERTLNEFELGTLLRHLRPSIDDAKESLATLCRRVIRLNLYLAGQRGEQLLQVPLARADLQSKPNATLTLLDPKGKRLTPRIHVLPLEGPALEQIQWFVRRSHSLASPWLFVSISPKNHMLQSYLSKTVKAISDAMVQNGDSAAPFTFGDLRRTVETMLAGYDVDDKTRAHLLSHGLSGVQDKTYNKWDYMPQKRRALALWHGILQRLEKAFVDQDKDAPQKGSQVAATPLQQPLAQGGQGSSQLIAGS
jgi:integrase